MTLSKSPYPRWTAIQTQPIISAPRAPTPCAPAAATGSVVKSIVSPGVIWVRRIVPPRRVAATALETGGDAAATALGAVVDAPVAGEPLCGTGRVSSIREKACLFRSDSDFLAPVRFPLLPLCLALGRTGGVVSSSIAAGICSGVYQK